MGPELLEAILELEPVVPPALVVLLSDVDGFP